MRQKRRENLTDLLMAVSTFFCSVPSSFFFQKLCVVVDLLKYCNIVGIFHFYSQLVCSYTEQLVVLQKWMKAVQD